MNVFNITILSASITVLAACSSSGTSTNQNETVESKSFDYQALPVKVRSLEVPPDLSSYTSDDKYGIQGEGESGTSFSDFSSVGSKSNSKKVLPPVPDVHLERQGTQRWLLVNEKAEKIWPIVKSFWEENGLKIRIENPEAGVMETDWAENRAKIPMDAFRGFLGKLFEGVFSSGEKDQYHTRLARSKDGNSTEIYISHYGMQEMPEKNDTGFRWVPRASDPELEATMLQLLMVKLGGGAGVLDNAQKSEKVTSGDSKYAPKLNKLADGSQSILLSESFDKSWRKVGLALDQAGIVLADKDRSKGIYYLSSGKNEIIGKPGTDLVKRIQVTVRESGSGSEVLVSDGAGGGNDATRAVIDKLYKALGRI